MSGTRVFKSKKPRDSRVVEALVMGTLEGVKPLHSSTIVCSAIFGTDVWLENVRLFTGYQHYEKEHTAHF